MSCELYGSNWEDVSRVLGIGCKFYKVKWSWISLIFAIDWLRFFFPATKTSLFSIMYNFGANEKKWLKKIGRNISEDRRITAKYINGICSIDTSGAEIHTESAFTTEKVCLRQMLEFTDNN